MERFYCDVLGYRVEWRPSPAELYLTRGEDNLALHALQPSAEAPRRESRLDHIGLLMSRPEDVDAWASYLEEKGLKLDTAPRTHRDGEHTFKGYLHRDFDEAFASYLPDQTVTPSQRNNGGHCDTFQSVTPHAYVTV